MWRNVLIRTFVAINMSVAGLGIGMGTYAHTRFWNHDCFNLANIELYGTQNLPAFPYQSAKTEEAEYERRFEAFRRYRGLTKLVGSSGSIAWLTLAGLGTINAATIIVLNRKNRLRDSV